MSVPLEKNMVIEGPLWPEPVRVLSVDHFGTMLQVDAVGTRTRQFYPGIIVTAAQVEALKVLSSAKGMDFSGDAEAFHLAVEAMRIRLAYEYDPHFAVNASTITPLPHQLDAVYRYMLKSPLVRFLLADDPGAGKTIMAGLLLKELRFRGLAERVLIVVPPLVARQWQEELASKFSEEFTIIDNGVLKANVGRNPWTETDRCITSVYWAARDNVLEPLKDADWDLVVVDEAHKMAAYQQGVRSQKTRKTRLYRLGEELSVRTKHLLLLTATPHKGDPENFRLLLELLDKDLFADRQILEEAMRSSDNPIILRRLKEEMRRFDGSPLFPQRTVKTVTFALSRAERELYDEVTEYVAEHFNKAMQKEKRTVGFAMTILQRRLTSSLAAITASLTRRHDRLQTLLDQVRALVATTAKSVLKSDDNDTVLEDLLGGAEVEDLDDLTEEERWKVEDSLVERLTNAESIEELQAEVLALERLVRRARAALSSGLEAKFIRLTDAILRDGGLAARGEKLLIFTEAKDTLDFLVERVRAQGFTVAVIDGSLSMEQRRRQQELFRGQAQVMVATEAGGESINLQFCNQMVNYDIPWNPNRLEQRMGRIHRIGQKNEVFIFNLVATDTREGAVLVALLNKMDEMRRGLGSDRVFDLVGDLLDDHEISLSDLIISCITNRRRLQDAVSSIEQAVSPQHQASLIAAREEGLARRFLNLPELRQDAARSESHALIPAHLETFFTRSLERNRGRWERRADGKLRVERVPVNLRREQEVDFRRRFGTVGRSYLSLSFDKKRVGEDGRTELLGPGHALFESVLQAAQASSSDSLTRGAVFFDVDAKGPELLWFFRGVVGDGTGRVLSQRLFAVREFGTPGSAGFEPAHPIRLHDLRPRTDDPPPTPLTDFDVRKHAATRFCLETLVPRFVEDVASGRLKELALKERYLERSFRVVISRHSDHLLGLESKSSAGQDMTLSLGREQRLMDEAKRRQQERLAQIRLEQQLVPRAPEFLGVVTVLPAPANVGAAKANESVLDQVRAYESSRGRVLEDVRREGVGFDAVASDAEGQGVDFLVARAVDGDGKVWLKSTEWTQLQHLNSHAALYVAKDDQLLRLAPKDATTAQVDEATRRVSIHIDGLQRNDG
ncbi:DEAD/DEAH box helicase [Vineibacter terrae]|uniref:DEAD/DEAH box helicase n=1 Tax=Vineibacter terrae TaxID=2586908 RepID=A0A5C8PDU9_9HYPH|nr:helicase-related protein [Vineibacter terrae]TXL71774.1 DEAD/DEAH box helicase [Vineibacter terrae]